jgi:DNA repair exonuclease SbcCD nuclease subunit
MNRTKSNKKVTAILCSDWHIREDTPTCWTGNFLDEQWINIQCVSNLQSKHKCPVIHAGDLFHHWKPSPWLLSMMISLLPKQFYTIYGQHDLPQHNWELRNKSGIYTLEQAGAVTVLDGCHYGQTGVIANMRLKFVEL